MKKIYYYLSLIVCLVWSTTTGFAQQIDVTGKVLSEEQAPISAASVYLLSAKTEALMKTTVTDESGIYTFKNVPHGEFIVQITSVGFETHKSEGFTVGSASVRINDVVLKTEAKAIAAVAVEGRVPLVQQRDGKLVLNVENSTLAAGNTAFEVVQRAPGVSVDKDENLQLMGQQGINVTIDGRQTYMSGEQLTTLLKTMSGDQIKSIEVSTTRSAKDDAEGAVGSINIVLKKNRLEGFNGTFLASAAQGLHTRGNSSLNLNYKKNNTTFFGSYGFARNKRQFDLDLTRTIVSSDNNRVFDQDAALVETEHNHNYRVGVEHKTSERNTMLLQFSGMNEREDSENTSLTNIGPTVQQADSVLHSDALTKTPFTRYSLNFNNELKLDSAGSKLVLDLDWSTFRTNSGINYVYRTMLPDGSLKYDPELERSQMPVDINIYVGKIDYTKMLGKAKIEAGVKYSNVKSDNDLQFEHFVNNQWQDYEGRPNHFVYTEQISAGYVDYSQVFGKLSLKLGLRGEYTVSDGNSITLNNRVKRDYFDLFPSANLGYTINENNILSLSYARKISRPNYRHLNPFEYYIDKFTFQRGNPYISPQYTDGLTLNYTAFKMFNFTLGTDITNGAMVESLGQDEETGKSWITRENLGKSVTSYLNVNAPVRIGKVWTMNNNLTTIYMTFKGPIAGSYVDVGSVFFQGRSMNNFRLSSAFSAEMSVNYNSPFLYNVYRIHSRWGTDLGVNYNFKEGRHSLKLAATDIFKTQRNNVTTDFEQFDAKIRQYNDNRTVRLTYTYKFGNLKQQVRRNGADSEEKSRAL